jgi:Winged helix DNA-binding domain
MPLTKLDAAHWRLRNQRLTGDLAADALAVVRDLCAVQAENHSQASWAIATRSTGVTETGFAQLYDDGHLLRTHLLRPTWHFVLPGDIGWLLDLSRPRVQRGWERQLEQEGIDRTLWERATTVVTEALIGTHLTRRQLGDRLTAEGMRFSRHALMLIAGLAEVHGLICSGARNDDEHTYALFAERVPQSRRLDKRDATVEVVVRYLAGHGPATERDIAYWATMTLGDVRAGLAEAADMLASFDVDGTTFWHHACDEPPLGPIGESAHLLQILDEYYRGYQESRLLLDTAGRTTPGRESSIGMTLIGSQIAGHMTRILEPDTVTFAIRPLRPLGADERTALTTDADRYGRFLTRTATVTFALH